MAQGKFEMDVKVRVKKDADKELKNEIEEMFDEYDLFLDLKKLNIPTDVAKGLFGIDSTSIEELRESLISRKDEFIGKDMLKEYEDYLKKLDDMEDKAQMDRLKKYLEYTRAAIGERAKIKVEEMNKLMEIEETFKPKELKQEHDIEKARTEGKTEEEIKALEKENKEIRKGNEEIKERNALLAEQKPIAIAAVQEEAKQKAYKGYNRRNYPQSLVVWITCGYRVRSTHKIHENKHRCRYSNKPQNKLCNNKAFGQYSTENARKQYDHMQCSEIKQEIVPFESSHSAENLDILQKKL
jgi:hypothetical protein